MKVDSLITQSVLKDSTKMLGEWLHAQNVEGIVPSASDKISQLKHFTGMVMSDMVLKADEKEYVITYVVGQVYGLRELDQLLTPPLSDEISNIEIIGFDTIFVTYRDERGRQLWDGQLGESDEDLLTAFENLASGRAGGRGRAWSDKDFVLNYKLHTGHRVHAIRKVATRPAITIRSHDMSLSSLDVLIEKQLMPPDVGEFLSAAVRGEANIVVSGATNCGKTTLLRALINEIPPDVRLITVEDNLELGIAKMTEEHPNTVELEAVPPNLEGIGGVTMNALLKESLRMNPDRVIVGEVRGEEMISMIKAMTQGNNGSLCSIHADSAEQSIRRMILYSKQSADVHMDEKSASESIIDAVDLIIYLKNEDGLRFVSEICEVIEGADGLAQAVHVYTMSLRHDDNNEIHGEVRYRYEDMSRKLKNMIEKHVDEDWIGWHHMRDQSPIMPPVEENQSVVPPVELYNTASAAM